MKNKTVNDIANSIESQIREVINKRKESKRGSTNWVQCLEYEKELIETQLELNRFMQKYYSLDIESIEEERPYQHTQENEYRLKLKDGKELLILLTKKAVENVINAIETRMDSLIVTKDYSFKISEIESIEKSEMIYDSNTEL